MGRVPMPMQPIPDDATPEQRLRIMQEYRAYVVRGLEHSRQMAISGVEFVIVLFVVIAIVLLALAAFGGANAR